MYRINELIKLDRRLYHTNDLAVLWGISNKNTLYTTIKRYVHKGIFIPIYKGLYSTVPVAQLNPLELGLAIIHRFAYLSTESVLATAGIISQNSQSFTFVSSLSKKVSVEGWTFAYRKLKDEYLNNPTGLVNQGGVFVATVDRAVADMQYFNPRYHFDVPGIIDWDQVKIVKQEVGYI